MRRDSREAVYKILYAELFNVDSDGEFEESVYKEHNLSAEDKSFAIALLSSVRDHKEEINEIIGQFAKGYKYERIYSTDKCALVIAVCELKYFNDIPSVVSIDEALFLVRKYSTEESLKFVNGLLAALKTNLGV